jgi:hypothetical protein
VVGVHLELGGHYQILEIENRIHAIVELGGVGDFNGLLNLRRVLDGADGGSLGQLDNKPY